MTHVESSVHRSPSVRKLTDTGHKTIDSGDMRRIQSERPHDNRPAVEKQVIPQ
jgi:hypothetical protein